MEGGAGKPLEGVGVLVTRAANQAEEMVLALEALGATAHAVPAIAIEAIPDPEGLEKALSAIADYDGLVFTSTNGVETFLDHLSSKRLTPAKAPVAYCVGPRTAEAWAAAGGSAARLPEKFTGCDMADAMGGDLSGKSYLVLRPRKVVTDVSALLRERGAKVDEVVLYATVADCGGAVRLQELLSRGALQAVTFTSPSTVRGTVEQAGGPGALLGLLCVCIGPTTAAAARKAGLTRVHSPREHTAAGMVSLLLALAEKELRR